MKPLRSLCLVVLAVTLFFGFVAVLPAANGASTKPPVAAASKSATNGTNATIATNTFLPIPSSVFDATTTPTKNPFFPNSTRKPIVPGATTNAPVGITASSFQLMILSGSSDSRLATINHRTFGVGEAVDVITSSGQKATIRVLQIKETSVVIRVINPSQPDLIELSLRKGAQ